jgi:hypothetical protein
MINSLILLYFTVFIFFQMGQRLAMTPIDTKKFIIIMLTIWIFVKNIA